MERQAYWFAYSAASRELRHPRTFHQVRDGAAFAELAFFLRGRGFAFGGTLFNPAARGRSVDRGPSDWPRFRLGDLIALTTRPPLDDVASHGGAPAIERSANALEVAVHGLVRSLFLSYCTRDEVRLADRLVAALPPSLRHLGSTQYLARKGRRFGATFHPHWCMEVRNGVGQQSTLGCFMFVPGSATCSETRGPMDSFVAHGQRPDLLAIFGISGVETLSWIHLLLTRDPAWLESSIESHECRFLLAEWGAQELTTNPVTLDFVHRIQVHAVFSVGSPGTKLLWTPIDGPDLRTVPSR